MRRKKAIPNAVRRAVCRRSGAQPGSIVAVKCHYCPTMGEIDWPENYAYWPITDLEFDHYVPEHAGGLTDESNIVLACRACNRTKGHSVPTEALVLTGAA